MTVKKPDKTGSLTGFVCTLNLFLAPKVLLELYFPKLLPIMCRIIDSMNEIIIFSVGIVLGNVISYIFFKVGIKSNIDAINYLGNTSYSEPIIPSKSDDYKPDTDTSLDWDGYPYTNEYNDADNTASSLEVIGYIDPETDDKN